MKHWTLTLEEDPETKELILPFTDEILEAIGWKEGDVKAVRPKGYKALCAAMKTQKDSSKDGKNSKPPKGTKRQA